MEMNTYVSDYMSGHIPERTGFIFGTQVRSTKKKAKKRKQEETKGNKRKQNYDR